MTKEFYVGTSGWMYKDWGKRFYPKDWKGNQLVYFSQKFRTVELNASFYRLPSGKTFALWKKITPENFKFAVKLNRYLTHRKRLIIDEESLRYLESFLLIAQNLGGKLAVILIQLPPSFKQNIPRLEIFLQNYRVILKKLGLRTRTALEFRHISWLDEKTFSVLKKSKVAWVISSTPQFRHLAFTADAAYIRMHGAEKKDYNYLKKDLDLLKSEIGKFPASVKNVFVYFNNDYSAYAVDNARYPDKILTN